MKRSCHKGYENSVLQLYDVCFKVRDMVPESQAYMDLLSFEKQLDSTIMRKKLEIQEAMKRPLKVSGCNICNSIHVCVHLCVRMSSLTSYINGDMVLTREAAHPAITSMGTW